MRLNRAAICAAATLLGLSGCSIDDATRDDGRHLAVAEAFLRGLYGGDPSVVDQFAAPDIVLSYPIFAERFGVPALRGRDAVRDFAAGFGRRWVDARVTVDDAVVQADTVVLVWSFRARSAAPDNVEADASSTYSEWGGITLYRFDEDGRITLEVGEESAPGMARRVPDAFPMQ